MGMADYSQDIVLVFTAFPILVFLAFVKVLYLKYRRIQSIHDLPVFYAPPSDCATTLVPSSRRSSRFIENAPNGFRNSYLVGLLGSPDWESKIHVDMDIVTREERRRSRVYPHNRINDLSPVSSVPSFGAPPSPLSQSEGWSTSRRTRSSKALSLPSLPSVPRSSYLGARLHQDSYASMHQVLSTSFADTSTSDFVTRLDSSLRYDPQRGFSDETSVRLVGQVPDATNPPPSLAPPLPAYVSQISTTRPLISVVPDRPTSMRQGRCRSYPKGALRHKSAPALRASVSSATKTRVTYNSQETRPHVTTRNHNDSKASLQSTQATTSSYYGDTSFIQPPVRINRPMSDVPKNIDSRQTSRIMTPDTNLNNVPSQEPLLAKERPSRTPLSDGTTRPPITVSRKPALPGRSSVRPRTKSRRSDAGSTSKENVGPASAAMHKRKRIDSRQSSSPRDTLDSTSDFSAAAGLGLGFDFVGVRERLDEEVATGAAPARAFGSLLNRA